MGLVASGHMTKMADTPFDPQFPKTPTIRKCYIAGIGNFAFFLRKIVEYIKIFVAPQKDVDDAEPRVLSHKTRNRSNGAISTGAQGGKK